MSKILNSKEHFTKLNGLKAFLFHLAFSVAIHFGFHFVDAVNLVEILVNLVIDHEQRVLETCSENYCGQYDLKNSFHSAIKVQDFIILF